MTFERKVVSNGKILEYKLRAGFPLLQYLQRYYPDGRVNSTGQFNATCCQCDKKDKFYYDVQKFKGLCQSCYSKRDGAGFKTVVGLIMFTESLEYAQALERLRSSSVTQDVGMSVMGEIFKFKDSIASTGENLFDLWEIPIRVDIPGQLPPDINRIRTFFDSRKRNMSMEILEAFPAYMSKVTFLQNRMVFKIETGESYAWLGYLLGKSDDENPKTLNPKGGVLSHMLGGYNYFIDKKEPILINEGIFDMFRCVLRRYNAVCLFGKVLSTRQVALINAMKTEEIVLCLDGDKAGLKGAWSIVKKWKKFINKQMSMMVLPYGEDPDSCPKDKFDWAYENRRMFT
jgi:hypothetical protein